MNELLLFLIFDNKRLHNKSINNKSVGNESAKRALLS